MRLGLGAIVETKHSGDDVGIVAGHADSADTAAEISLGILVLFEFDVEGFLEIGYGAGEQHGAAGEFGASFMHLQAEVVGKLLDLVEIGWIGAVGMLVFAARHVPKAGLFEGAY